MLSYGLVVIPLTCQLKEYMVNIHQPWHSDDSVCGGGFSLICEFWYCICTLGNTQIYLPETTNSILVTRDFNIDQDQPHFSELHFRLVM